MIVGVREQAALDEPPAEFRERTFLRMGCTVDVVPLVVADDEEAVRVGEHGLEQAHAQAAEGPAAQPFDHFGRRGFACTHEFGFACVRSRRTGRRTQQRLQRTVIDRRILGTAREPEIAIGVAAVSVRFQDVVVLRSRRGARGMRAQAREEMLRVAAVEQRDQLR